MKKTYVIIGNSAAGLSAVNKLRQLDKDAEIICISKEKENPYNKCKLAQYLSGDFKEENVFTNSLKELEGKNITVVLGQKVREVMSDNRFVLLQNGEKISYDKLFISTGASAIRPNIPGNSLPGVFTLQMLGDTNNILDFIKKNKPKNAVVIGSGMTGIESADSLCKQGINVSIVEMCSNILSNQNDKFGSEMIESNIVKSGAKLFVNEKVEEIIMQDGAVSCVALRSGKFIAADMVVFAVGVRPNIDLVKNSGVTIGENGILVDDFMKTNIDSIFAGGDVACVRDFMSGAFIRSCTWPDACMQGIIAANSMFGKEVKYNGAFSTSYSDIFDLKFASCLGSLNHKSKYDEFVKKDKNFYNKIFVKDGLVHGFLLIGNISNLGILKRHLMSKQKLDFDALSY